MQNTPQGERLHIGIFGRRNAGKSSVINLLTNQDIALVSDIPGTTTDPVYKAMELLPLGPVMIIDTAGFDDEGDLGVLRVERTKKVLQKTDLAVLVVDINSGITDWEREFVKQTKTLKIPTLMVLNKIDLNREESIIEDLGLPCVKVSAFTGEGIEDLKQLLVKKAPGDFGELAIIGDLINPGDVVVLVIPIDLAAPKGRLILPQVQTMRDILDHDAYALVVKERELKDALANLGKKPKIIVTDSQAFNKVAADTSKDVWLTSFSILFARYKGELESLVEGAKAIETLKPGDKVLIAEACTHHRQADDIGKVQIPRWLRQLVGGDLEFTWTSGTGFPDDLADYKLVVHCGACMINRREMLRRIWTSQDAGVPIVNYGVLLAHVHGVMPRALDPFPWAKEIWESGNR